MQADVDRGAVGGAVTLLYRRGEIAQVNTLGWQDPATKTPMTRDSIFRIASMTKPITAAAALDDRNGPIGAYLSECLVSVVRKTRLEIPILRRVSC
jgi:CubicO group peptidase (beta-lactamase class C family)